MENEDDECSEYHPHDTSRYCQFCLDQVNLLTTLAYTPEDRRSCGVGPYRYADGCRHSVSFSLLLTKFLTVAASIDIFNDGDFSCQTLCRGILKNKKPTFDKERAKIIFFYLIFVFDESEL